MSMPDTTGMSAPTTIMMAMAIICMISIIAMTLAAAMITMTGGRATDDDVDHDGRRSIIPASNTQ